MASTPWEHYSSQKNNIVQYSILNTVNDWNLWNPLAVRTVILKFIQIGFDNLRVVDLFIIIPN